MNQIKIGKFIAQKRKEQNLTQEQFAEHLSVSNKTVSKWETGKCMPDYSIVEPLCDELKITISELINGEEDKEKRTSSENEQMFDLLKRTQELEKQKTTLLGLVLIIMGVAFQALSRTFGGTNVKDFFSGLLLGLSIAEMLVGIYVIARGLIKK